ncbi:hypothetical protein TWF281_002147 [Arthrobotrys megalospora]
MYLLDELDGACDVAIVLLPGDTEDPQFLIYLEHKPTCDTSQKGIAIEAPQESFILMEDLQKFQDATYKAQMSKLHVPIILIDLH